MLGGLVWCGFVYVSCNLEMILWLVYGVFVWELLVYGVCIVVCWCDV